jgi:hypothetical protein
VDLKAGLDSEMERKINVSVPGIQPQSSTYSAVTLLTELDNIKVYQINAVHCVDWIHLSQDTELLWVEIQL